MEIRGIIFLGTGIFIGCSIGFRSNFQRLSELKMRDTEQSWSETVDKKSSFLGMRGKYCWSDGSVVLVNQRDQFAQFDRKYKRFCVKRAKVLDSE